MIGPYFFRPSTVEELVCYCEEVAAAAPDLPFYYYHIPAMSGVTLSMRDFLELAGDRIPSLAGIKFTHPDPMDIRKCLSWRDGRYEILFGMDEALLAALALGCRAAVGTTYGFAAPLSQAIIAAFDRGEMDEARRLQSLSVEMVAVYRKYGGGHPAMKVMMKICGIDCGPVRPPLRPLSREQEVAFREEIEATGGLRYCPGAEAAD
jgi:N-acetylneuraminate lyase